MPLSNAFIAVFFRNNSTSPVINSDILSSKVLNVKQDAFSSLNEPVKLVFSLQVCMLNFQNKAQVTEISNI